MEKLFQAALTVLEHLEYNTSSKLVGNLPNIKGRFALAGQEPAGPADLWPAY